MFIKTRLDFYIFYNYNITVKCTKTKSLSWRTKKFTSGQRMYSSQMKWMCFITSANGREKTWKRRFPTRGFSSWKRNLNSKRASTIGSQRVFGWLLFNFFLYITRKIAQHDNHLLSLFCLFWLEKPNPLSISNISPKD